MAVPLALPDPEVSPKSDRSWRPLAVNRTV